MSTATNLATIHLKTIGQIAVTVRDLTVSTEFYRDTLGMQFLFAAGPMSFFQCDSVRLLLGTAEGQGEDKPVAAPTSTILYFKVDDLAQTHKSLAARGVEFLQGPHLVAKMPSHDLWMAFLKDPDGNTIGLMNEIRNNASTES